MATVRPSVEMNFGRLIGRLEEVSRDWSDDERGVFANRWKAMEREGAEMVDTRICGNRIIAFPSEDFTKHCEAFGICLA